MRDREGGSQSSPWDMSCPRKLFLDERKSLFQRKSVFRDVRMQARTEQRTANVQVSRTVEVVQARQPHFTLI